MWTGETGDTCEIVAVIIDGKCFADDEMIIALVVRAKGLGKQQNRSSRAAPLIQMYQWRKREYVTDYLPKGRNAYFRIVPQRAYEEILTLHRLGLLEKVGRSLKTSNCIESLMALIGAEDR